LKRSPKENAVSPETRRKIMPKNIVPYIALVKKGGRRTRKHSSRKHRI
jgi:hypothetical protein